jgi:two-component system cell cycle response regulator DivK
MMDSRTILIADDNLDNRSIFGFLLESFGFTVLTAENGCEAVLRAREHHPDLILMDISMPVMDGLQATALLRGDRATAKIPVIAVTAHNTAEMRKRAEEAGCNCFLSKPVPLSRILEEVEPFFGDRRIA